MAKTVKQQWIKQWMEGAETDLEAARRLCTIPGILSDIIYFHCRQLVENALKGYLTANGRIISKSQDLATLLEQCRELSPEFGQFTRECATLDNWVLKPADIQIVLHSAETIVTEVKSKLMKAG